MASALLCGDTPRAAAPMVTEPLLVTIEETARLLSCSPGLVKLLIRRGVLRPVKLGRLTRIPLAQLHAIFVPAERVSSCNCNDEQLQLCGSSSPPSARRVGALQRKRRA